MSRYLYTNYMWSIHIEEEIHRIPLEDTDRHIKENASPAYLQDNLKNPEGFINFWNMKWAMLWANVLWKVKLQRTLVAIYGHNHDWNHVYQLDLNGQNVTMMTWPQPWIDRSSRMLGLIQADKEVLYISLNDVRKAYNNGTLGNDEVIELYYDMVMSGIIQHSELKTSDKEIFWYDDLQMITFMQFGFSVSSYWNIWRRIASKSLNGN